MGVTIKDIANKAGVSVATVSRVINNKPDVSETTRKRIQRILKMMNYNPNNIARGMVLKRTFTLGLIIPDISNPFFPEVAKGIEDMAKKRGYSVIYYNTNNDPNEEKEAIKILLSKQVDGIILSFLMDNAEELKRLEREKYKVVQIDRKVPSANFPAVVIDNIQSSYELTSYLIGLGHGRIASITGDLNTKTGQDRLKGFKKAIENKAISLPKEFIVEGDYSRGSGYTSMMKLLHAPITPTAVFAANDLMAIGAYAAIFEKGLRIPTDISIVGHDDIDVASVVRPGLTTMAQPKYRIGERAVELLVNSIEEKEIYQSEEIILKTNLVLRSSAILFEKTRSGRM